MHAFANPKRFLGLAHVDDDDLRVVDSRVLQALKRLAGVDLAAPDRDHLFMHLDFQAWKEDLARE